MIKINLVGTKSDISSDQLASMGEVSASDFPTIRKTAIERGLLLVIFPMILLAYEQWNLPMLSANISRKQKELATLSAKNNEAKTAVAEIKKFKKDQENLQAQISAIEALKVGRLREVKILDYIQKDLPEKMWLERVSLEDSKISISGLSTTDAELTQFMDALSRSAFLKEVNLVKSTDFSSDIHGSVKKFEVSCLMEKSP